MIAHICPEKRPWSQGPALPLLTRAATPARRDGERMGPAAWPVLLLLLARVPAGVADGGPFGIDDEWTYDNSGIWKRSNQLTDSRDAE